jgi:hypothetical protein
MTKPIDIPQTLSSVSISPSSPPNQLYLSAPPTTTSFPDATVQPIKRGHDALGTSADPAPSSGHKCCATLTSAQQAPQLRHCDDANCGPSSAVGHRKLPEATTPAMKISMCNPLHPNIHIRSSLMPTRLPPSASIYLHHFLFLTIPNPPISTKKSPPHITLDHEHQRRQFTRAVQEVSLEGDQSYNRQ